MSKDRILEIAAVKVWPNGKVCLFVFVCVQQWVGEGDREGG